MAHLSTLQYSPCHSRGPLLVIQSCIGWTYVGGWAIQWDIIIILEVYVYFSCDIVTILEIFFFLFVYSSRKWRSHWCMIMNDNWEGGIRPDLNWNPHNSWTGIRFENLTSQYFIEWDFRVWTLHISWNNTLCALGSYTAKDRMIPLWKSSLCPRSIHHIFRVPCCVSGSIILFSVMFVADTLRLS